jgi:DNA adenine methylase
MMYQGGKARIANPIAEILSHGAKTGRTTYVEPFVGSAAVFHRVAPHYETAVGADAMLDLVLLWSAAVDGWIPPTDLSEETYRSLRDAAPSALRAFAGFPCSFGGKWFGGYARDPKSNRNFARTASQSIAKRAAAMPHATFVWSDYRDLRYEIDENAVVYCDPPYAGTTSYAGAGEFNSEEFWTIAAKWAASGALVFVSEYAAPPEWREIWATERHVSTARDNTGARATDRLFALPSTIEALGLDPSSFSNPGHLLQ